MINANSTIVLASVFAMFGCGRISEVPTAPAITPPTDSGAPLADAGAQDARIGCYYVDYYGKGSARFCPLRPSNSQLNSDCVGIDGCNKTTCELRDGIPTLLHPMGTLACPLLEERDE